jgi:glycosyltransferase 2 family protein
MKPKDYFWPIVGLAAVAFSLWLLYHELKGLSLDELWDSLTAIPLHGWLLSVLATLGAYAALAGYDHIALLHLRRRVHWFYITVTSFTTYALAHNIGASVFSGAVVRYRAYSAKGLSAKEVGILVAFCSFTFALATVFLTALVLVFQPEIGERFGDLIPIHASITMGLAILALIALYVVGAALRFRPLRLGRLTVEYPRLPIVARQLSIGSLELIAAAAIIYFALPAAGNPGFVTVLGIFLVSFSAALISHAPGGLGVLELVFVTGLPDMDPADVLAALLVFRLLYLIIPFVMALVVILVFERMRLSRDGSHARI